MARRNTPRIEDVFRTGCGYGESCISAPLASDLESREMMRAAINACMVKRHRVKHHHDESVVGEPHLEKNKSFVPDRAWRSNASTTGSRDELRARSSEDQNRIQRACHHAHGARNLSTQERLYSV